MFLKLFDNALYCYDDETLNHCQGVCIVNFDTKFTFLRDPSNKDNLGTVKGFKLEKNQLSIEIYNQDSNILYK